MKENIRVPYGQLEAVDYRYIRQVRFLRSKSLIEFEKYMGVDSTVISRIENGHIAFSPVYQERFKVACKRLRVSNLEIDAIRRLLAMKRK